jgi:uncharacterized protein YijF (DUF1287 family)
MCGMLDRRTLLLGMTAGLAGCGGAPQASDKPSRARLPASGPARSLIVAARSQLGVTRYYDSAYTALPFPGGDVPRIKGVCTDVVIRAYRDAFGIDLQALVNADVKRAFAAYPRKWGLTHPDPSIDHRRVPHPGRRQGLATGRHLHLRPLQRHGRHRHAYRAGFRPARRACPDDPPQYRPGRP